MSLEFLVLLALFTLLPIIEQAWRKHRDARERAKRRAQGLPPVPPPLPPPIPRVPPGHAPLPTRTEALDEDDEVAVVVRPTPRPRPTAAAPPRTLAPPARRQRPRLRDFARDPDAVRRGIVLMTVLGPCRANAPYDIPAVGRTAPDQ